MITIGITVLSLFDGISCGQVALEHSGIEVDTYYASEIEKSAIKITNKNYPNTIQLGDVTKVRYIDGILHTENGDFNVGEIDLLIGGSPCTDVSRANVKGKGLKGEHSSLFYEYYRIFKEVKPTYFLLENAGTMSSEDKNTISELLGVKPVLINSSNFVPQNRLRNYWTSINIPNIIPKETSLESVLELNVHDIYYLNSENHIFINGGSTNNSKLKFLGGIKTKKVGQWLDDGKQYSRNFKQGYRVYDKKGHASTLTASGGGLGGKTTLVHIGDNLDNIDVNNIRRLTPNEAEKLQGLPVGYTNIESKSNRLKGIGNGWTVDVIKHIFSGLKNT